MQRSKKKQFKGVSPKVAENRSTTKNEPNAMVLVDKKWLQAKVLPYKQSKNHFLCTITQSDAARKMRAVGHEIILDKSKVQTELSIIITVKKMGPMWYVLLDGKSDLSDMKWKLLEGTVVEMPGFIKSKSGRVYQVTDGEGMVGIRFIMPSFPLSLKFNPRLGHQNWTIKGSCLIRHGFQFQHALLENRLMEYTIHNPLPNICHNFSVIMSAINSMPFWQKSLKKQFRAIFEERVKKEPEFAQTVTFYLSANQVGMNQGSTKRKAKNGSQRGSVLPPSKRKSSMSSSSSLTLQDDFSSDLVDIFNTTSSAKTLLGNSDHDDPTVNFWREFSRQSFKKDAIVYVPKSITAYEPCHPELGQLMMLKVLRTIPSSAAPILLQAYVRSINMSTIFECQHLFPNFLNDTAFCITSNKREGL